MVTNLSTVVPVLILVSDHDLAGAGPPEQVVALQEYFLQALSDTGKPFPGPEIYAPFDLLPVMATRDIESDLESAQPPDGVAAALWHNYELFLGLVRDALPIIRLLAAFHDLDSAQSASELDRLLERHPDMCSDFALNFLRGYRDQAVPNAGPERLILDARIDLLRSCADGAVADGWARYEKALSEIATPPRGQKIEHLLAVAGSDDADLADRMEASEALLESEAAKTDLDLRFRARFFLVNVLFALSGDGHADRLERCIELGQLTLGELDAAGVDAPEIRYRTLMNLGTAFGARIKGDAIGNAARCIDFQREALQHVSIESDGYSWSMAQTNLGYALSELAMLRGQGRSYLGSEVDEAYNEAIEEAIQCFRAALRWRSFDRDPGDWAFTMNNLGLAYARSKSGDAEPNARGALLSYQEAARGFSASGRTQQEATAIHNAANQYVFLAGLYGAESSVREDLLREGIEGYQRTIALLDRRGAPLEIGRAWRQLGTALVQVDDRPGAIDAFAEALRDLDPDIAPRDCRDAAGHLATLLIENGDWDRAAEASLTAALAASSAAARGATSANRLGEVRQGANLFRWAAYALARVGRTEEAVEILELGRAREVGGRLRRDDSELEQLRQVSSTLHESYRLLQARLDAVEQDVATGSNRSVAMASDLNDELERVIREIRRLPDFEHFLMPPSFADTIGPLRADEALVYLLTSPHGAMGLIAQNRGDHGTVKVISCPDLTSTGLASLFVNHDPVSNVLEGYLPAQTTGVHAEIDAALGALEEELGPRLLKPVAETLVGDGVQTAILVPIALLGLLPLQAMRWLTDEGPRCLIDDLRVVFAPSGLARHTCVRRAARTHDETRLVAVGNPLPSSEPLRGAEAEAEMVAATLEVDQVNLLTGYDATKASVVAALPGASHVHFACHGESSFFDVALNAGLRLAADELLPSSELLAIDSFAPRLVVASACETGVIQDYETADEALAIASVFVAAGAAGVIGSMWQVGDLSTQVLMTRFYEELAAGEHPADALRVAQIWLRDVSLDEVAESLKRYPGLRALAAGSDGGAVGQSGTDVRPFASPSSWAAFVFTGA